MDAGDGELLTEDQVDEYEVTARVKAGSAQEAIEAVRFALQEADGGDVVGVRKAEA